MDKKYICLDIGGTKILGVIFDSQDNILHRVKTKTTPEKGIEKVNENILEVIRKLSIKEGISISDIEMISLGVPGVSNVDTGYIEYGHNLFPQNYDLSSVIKQEFNIPLLIGNDVNLGIYGEYKYGCAKGRNNVAGLFIGTGIGGGIILNGRLFTGAKNSAGELGHVVLNTDGPYCNCGRKGCLEAFASKLAITREIRAQLDRGRESILKDMLEPDRQVIKSRQLRIAVEANDQLAIEVVDRAINYIACGIDNLVNVLNPDAVILGGGVIEALSDYMMPRIKTLVGRFKYPSSLSETEILKSQLGDDAVLYGALALIKNELFI